MSRAVRQSEKPPERAQARWAAPGQGSSSEYLAPRLCAQLLSRVEESELVPEHKMADTRSVEIKAPLPPLAAAAGSSVASSATILPATAAAAVVVSATGTLASSSSSSSTPSSNLNTTTESNSPSPLQLISTTNAAAAGAVTTSGTSGGGGTVSGRSTLPSGLVITPGPTRDTSSLATVATPCTVAVNVQLPSAGGGGSSTAAVVASTGVVIPTSTSVNNTSGAGRLILTSTSSSSVSSPSLTNHLVAAAINPSNSPSLPATSSATPVVVSNISSPTMGSRRVTLVPAQPTTPLLSKAQTTVLISQQQQQQTPNHLANSALVQHLPAPSTASSSHLLQSATSGAVTSLAVAQNTTNLSIGQQQTSRLPPSATTTFLTPISQIPVNAMPGNVLQGNGTALKPLTGLPNGSTSQAAASQQLQQQIATSSANNISNQLLARSNLQGTIPVSLSAIPQLVIASTHQTGHIATLTSVTSIASHNTNSNNPTLKSTVNLTPQPHHKPTVLVSTGTAKDGGGGHPIVFQAAASGLPPNNTLPQQTANLNNHTTVLTSKQQPQTNTTQQVSNPNIMPVMFNVPGRAGAPTAVGIQRPIAPRFVVNGPVRLAHNQVMSGLRPGIQLPPNMRGAFLLKTENGQYQLVNVGGGGIPASALTPGGLPQGIRLQSSMAGGQQLRHTAPQMTVSLPVSIASNIQQQHQRVPMISQSVTQPLTIQTTTANSNAAAPSQMSPNTAKKKCKNFLSTLIRLASDQPEQVATNVKNLIQGLIDGLIQPEDFTNQLQKELNSSPQPCLVPFLKKSLPYLRHSLMIREMTIDGVQAPPQGSVQLPTQQHAIPQIQIASQGSAPRPGMGTTLRFLTSVQPGMAMTNQPMGAVINRPVTTMFATPQQVTPATPQPAPPPPPAPTKAASAPAKSKSSSKARSPAAATKEKKASAANATGGGNFATSRDDDDINDVAAMGGVSLAEESQRMASTAEFVGTQIRSIKDETFLFTSSLHNRINQTAKRLNLEEASQDVVSIVSHAAQEYLKTLVEKLGVIAEHRLEVLRNDTRYETTQDVRGQIKFLEELDRLEKKRHEEQEREMLLRAAKSRSKLEDPEQLKLKQKAKEMQRAEQEEVRQREANETALLAIGPRKRMKMSESPSLAASGMNNNSNSNSSFPSSQTNSTNFSGPFATSSSKSTIRRMKRVNMRDLQFLMEQERETVRSTTLYKAYAK